MKNYVPERSMLSRLLRTYRADSVQQSRPLGDRTVMSPERMLKLDGCFRRRPLVPRRIVRKLDMPCQSSLVVTEKMERCRDAHSMR